MKEIYNEDIERAYIGALITDNELIASSNLKEDMFYLPIYKRMFKFIKEVNDKDKKVDMILMKNKLEKHNLLNDVGGLSGLADMFSAYSSSLDVKIYEEKIKKTYIQRNLYYEGERLKGIALSGEDLDEGVEKIYENINSLMRNEAISELSFTDGVTKMLNTIEENMGKDLIGYSWGNSFLDEYTKGVRKGKTYRIGAPSGVGKTNLVYQTIKHLLGQGAKVMFASLENSIDTTYIKLLSSMQEVSPNALEGGEILPDVSLLEKYKNHLHITDQIFSFNEITREIKKFKPDVVFLDYIGLVDIKGCDEKTIYNSYADKQKKFIQKNQEIAWVDLSNLNKDDDEDRIRGHKGFNGSGKLRNNTDFAMHMFYYKPFYEAKNETKENWGAMSEQYSQFMNRQAITFLISKNRLGMDGEEKQFVINFDKGINYIEATPEMKKGWGENVDVFKSFHNPK